MDLFEYAASRRKESDAPLASRIRPRSLDEVVGQKHIIGEGCMLRRAICADKLSSVIFYGPPGTGKTTLAQVIAHTTSAEFTQINATAAGKKDMEEVVARAKESLYFEVNGALLSRSVIFELRPLSAEDIEVLLTRAAADPERGMGAFDAVLEEDALHFLADAANGDARSALNALELGVLTTPRGEDGRIRINLEVAQECIQKRVARYDRDGDQHYDTISAFIKSMRGSDPDAAVFYLARMLRAGEDIRFIARRIMICAAEDVGCADPQALVVAVSAAQACERIGMPESQLILSEAAIYVACAPKSNSCTNAIFDAYEAVDSKKFTIPPYLQDAHYKGSSKLGRGIGYEYAHDFPKHFSRQRYLPEELGDVKFYQPSANGYERQVRRYLDWLHEEAASDEKENEM